MSKKPTDTDDAGATPGTDAGTAADGERREFTHPLSVKIPADLKARLKAWAEDRGVSRSHVVREALRGFLLDGDRPSGGRSFTALAADLAGCVDGPEDLSTGEQHMDGYGT